MTFEDNLGNKGNLPAVVYVDFERTAPSDNCFNPEQKSMFVVSYIIIVAFHLKLKMDGVNIHHNFGHFLEKRTTTDYLTNDQTSFVDVNLIKQLKDSALNVHGKKCKNAIAQMFSIDLSLVKKTILSWFNRKIKSQHLEIDLLRKNKYKKEHPINWHKDKCLIGNFPLKIDPIGPDFPNKKMSYGDFFY